MKKILLPVLFFCTSFLFALETSYPVILNNGTILINSGIGFGRRIKNDHTPRLCPPLTVSIDSAIPVAGLPWTVGLTTGYFSEANSLEKYHYLPIGGRTAYHLNFNVPRLDTYILLTLGAALSYENGGFDSAYFWYGINAGGRYFFHPNIGAYMELGIDRVHIISIGLSFKI